MAGFDRSTEKIRTTGLPVSCGDYAEIGLLFEQLPRRPPESMAWIWMLSAAGAVLLWAISLGRILSSPAPSCLPPSPHFMSPLRGDRRSRNVLLVIAHPDDESMYASSSLRLFCSSSQKVTTFTFCVCLKVRCYDLKLNTYFCGNADGLGNTRKEELYHACDTFKILTFDSHGISGHPNHQDVHHGIWISSFPPLPPTQPHPAAADDLAAAAAMAGRPPSPSFPHLPSSFAASGSTTVATGPAATSGPATAASGPAAAAAALGGARTGAGSSASAAAAATPLGERWRSAAAGAPAAGPAVAAFRLAGPDLAALGLDLAALGPNLALAGPPATVGPASAVGPTADLATVDLAAMDVGPAVGTVGPATAVATSAVGPTTATMGSAIVGARRSLTTADKGKQVRDDLVLDEITRGLAPAQAPTALVAAPPASTAPTSHLPPWCYSTYARRGGGGVATAVGGGGGGSGEYYCSGFCDLDSCPWGFAWPSFNNPWFTDGPYSATRGTVDLACATRGPGALACATHGLVSTSCATRGPGVFVCATRGPVATSCAVGAPGFAARFAEPMQFNVLSSATSIYNSKFLHENGQGNIEAWQLASLNLFRKYSGPLDIWLASQITSSSKEPTYTLVNNSPSRSYQAMAAHRSQWVW
ncbi:hypothetical protein PR202_gb15847 [Eleusine coracana subsp. coracana]|uniref:N-acetylglucosaminylphosphatidylinositol deacetylase n=1 Tax=Eleusine coracana subsp. coracana TaxID=191504 RepID=A0AAV5F0K7_ELECO|nr:hypothetical protein PR202_gb15847 [Eleusine coracana subsp. coracana]